jgi:alkylation response protein AidB-like acyl-CoA dehydrogenase
MDVITDATMDLTEVREQLRSVARDLLGSTGTAAPTWRQLAEVGWLGLEVPESLDGAGATFAEVAVVLEEMGRAATCAPYLGTAALGVGALGLLEPNRGRDGLLRLTAAGDRTVAVALTDGADRADAPDVVASPPFRVESSPRGLRLHGRARFVPDAPDADRLLLLALDPDGSPAVVVVHAPPETPHLDVAVRPMLDATRRFGDVAADGVEVSEAAVWRFSRDPEAAVWLLLDRAAVAIACDSLGLAEAMLDATVAYAGEREQFGRPIGSFQAVKHACADMLVAVSLSRELVAAAVGSLVAGDPDAWVAASMAKAHACEAAVDVVGKALQLHGGIGYTWESGVHSYLKRAVLNRSLFGSPRAHRHRLAARFPQWSTQPSARSSATPCPGGTRC